MGMTRCEHAPQMQRMDERRREKERRHLNQAKVGHPIWLLETSSRMCWPHSLVHRWPKILGV